VFCLYFNINFYVLKEYQSIREQSHVSGLYWLGNLEKNN